MWFCNKRLINKGLHPVRIIDGVYRDARQSRRGFCPVAANVGAKRHVAGSGPQTCQKALQTFRRSIPALGVETPQNAIQAATS